MHTQDLVEAFYERIWNAGDLDAVAELVSADFSFRGSLGIEVQGREAFKDYVCSIRGALANYRGRILTCVSETEQAFAKMQFSGLHVAPFCGYPATGKPVHWLGAALFRFRDKHIAELWVLGDLAGLDAVLKKNEMAQPATDMESESSLEALRARIDRIDEAFVRLLAERFGLTNQIGQYKKVRQLGPVDEERERQQCKRIRLAATEAGLNPDFADRILRCIIDEVVQNRKKI